MAIVFVDELQTGDVLLMMGNAEVSKVIAWCSNSEYSHAAIVADRQRLFEANSDGARYVDISERVRNTEHYLYIRGFRLRDRVGNPFSPADQALLLRKIASLEHTPYPFGDILTLGMAVAASRKLIENERLRMFLKMLFDYLIDRTADGMSCAELVYRCLSENDAWPKGRLSPVIMFPEKKQGPHWDINLPKLFKEFCDGIAHDEKAKEHFEWFCKHFRDDANATPVSEEEFAATLQRLREKYGLDVPPDGAQPDPNPNPRLVQPEDFNESPSCTLLGDVIVRGD